MPVVDDPFDFGRIAATNALSDVYAMGGTPILALAIVGMPIDKLAAETIRRILEGGESVCAAAGIPVAGGHSIDTSSRSTGSSRSASCIRPGAAQRRRAAGRRADPHQGAGVGVFSAALKQERLNAAGYAALIASHDPAQRRRARLGGIAGVHAVTDVTGFGLLGHALEMCRGAGLTARIRCRRRRCCRASRRWRGGRAHRRSTATGRAMATGRLPPGLTTGGATC